MDYQDIDQCDVMSGWNEETGTWNTPCTFPACVTAEKTAEVEASRE